MFLRVYAEDKLITTETQKPNADRTYALAARLKPGLVNYRTEFGAKTAGRETVLHTATNLVCGDAFLIDGQSNAEATDVGRQDPTYTSDWIRSFGTTAGDPQGARRKLSSWEGARVI